ncbi:hypothetical protein U1Q18_022551 [Sarracenia purpurea var. burkii]
MSECQILDVIKEKPNLRKISFVAHSVGGLVARYVIGRLFRPPIGENVEDILPESCEEVSKGTIGGLELMNFITVATPHLGSRGNKQDCFLRFCLSHSLSAWGRMVMDEFKEKSFGVIEYPASHLVDRMFTGWNSVLA